MPIIDNLFARLPYHLQNNLVSNRILQIPWFLAFQLTILTGKPYFGRIYRANQVNKQRKVLMEKLINRVLKNSRVKNFKILEIGSWAGSSAVIWAGACKKNDKGIVYCIDNWETTPNAPHEMLEAVKNKKILKLFLHNIEKSNLAGYVFPMVGSSDKISDILKLECFDFVYIDGDHSYKQFTKDLRNYSGLLKVNGILCGDDLESFHEQIDIKSAKTRLDEDFIIDPKTKNRFHPGITFGIQKFFGKRISMKDGFWTTKKTKNGWCNIDFEEKI